MVPKSNDMNDKDTEEHDLVPFDKAHINAFKKKAKGEA